MLVAVGFDIEKADTRGLLVVVGTDMRGLLVAIGFDIGKADTRGLLVAVEINMRRINASHGQV